MMIATSALHILSGPGGWLGIAAFQKFLLSVSTQCAEPFTGDYFRDAKYFIAVPALFFTDTSDPSITNREIFWTLLGLMWGLLLLHALVALAHYKLIAPFGSFQLSAIRVYFPLPFLFVTALNVVAIGKHAYSGVIDDKTPYVRVVFIVAWLIFSLVFLIFWYEGLRRGYDGYFLKYRETELKVTLAAVTSNADDDAFYKTRLQRVIDWLKEYFSKFFALTGSWPLTRAWGVLRGLTSDRASYYTLIYMLFAGAFGINGAHRGVDTTFCYATYWNSSALLVVLMVLTLFFLPLRMPFLNFLWVAIHFLEFAFNATSAEYVVDDEPEGSDAAALPRYAIGVLCLHLGLATTSFVIMFNEVVLGRRQRNLERHRREQQERIGDADLDAPLLDLNKILHDGATGSPTNSATLHLRRSPSTSPTGGEPRVGASALNVSRSPSPNFRANPLMSPGGLVGSSSPPTDASFAAQTTADWKGSWAARDAEQRRLAAEEQRRQRLLDMRRFVVELHPCPARCDEHEVMLLFSVYAAIDVLIVGATAFVGIRGRRMAEAAVSSFNGRLLHGELVKLRIVEDAGGAADPL